MSITRPMLAGVVPLDDKVLPIEYPKMVSPKVDGIRCICHPDLGPVTVRKFKPIPNDYIRNYLAQPQYRWLDGEIVSKHYTGANSWRYGDFNETQSAVMSRGGTPDFEFMVFDCFVDPEKPFEERFFDAVDVIMLFKSDSIIRPLHHMTVNNQEKLLELDRMFIEQGWEGTMLRDPRGPYKQGRSTLRQGWLLKLKRFMDAEGIVIDFEELKRNENEATLNLQGYTERSSHKANKKGADTLGALVLKTKWGTLKVGSGFDMATRDLIWSAKEQYLGKKANFKYQVVGLQNLPRFPIFRRFVEDD